MDDWKGKVVGGAIVLVLGGTGFAVSQSDIIDNFANETGMSQNEAKQYVEDSQAELESFENVGADFTKNGDAIIADAAEIDCAEWQYEWESPSLSCDQGKSFIAKMGTQEKQLGQCFKELDADLGSGAESKIHECINHIDTLNTSYKNNATVAIYGNEFAEESTKSNAFNKSVLKAALESNK